MILSTAHTGACDVWLSLRGTTYPNNSIMTLEDIDERNDALVCATNLAGCCRHPYTGGYWPYVGNWFFPNGTRVPSGSRSWDFYRIRGQMMIYLNRRSGGVEGIYRCEIPNSMNTAQTLYIGVYHANTSSGEWHCLYALVLYNYSQTV